MRRILIIFGWALIHFCAPAPPREVGNKSGIEAPPPADQRTLLQRLYLDLTPFGVKWVRHWLAHKRLTHRHQGWNFWLADVAGRAI
ncbi:MAG: hypothetical protein HUU41_09650 [Bryobacteraceae bacterium]|nr:hypothetical protein [Bryobacterales bacterium]MEB2360785.1 hypothetical protein [Bryobacterales bacterium]NUN01366.1 hypothetical protein [Bryobacteraceae bacterium]